MSYIFCKATSFNQPLDNWDISNVLYMTNMFYGAISFNQQLNNLDVSNVINLYGTFEGATSFNQPLNKWNVGNVTNMRNMFNNTKIGLMLDKHKLSEEQFFESPTNKKVYHELFGWPRKKEYIMFLVNNQYLPLNKHQEEHEYHPLFDNPDISKYIAYYL